MENQTSWAVPGELLQLAREGETELIAEVFSMFQADSASRLQVLRAAVAGGDTKVVGTQAHALKGSAGQVGAHGMARICLEMEQAARAGSTAEFSGLLERLEGIFTEVSQAMSALDLGELCYGS